jgi:three-Cys-motif partner protein
MSSSKDFDFDEIGYWSEIKLEIIRKYAQAYSTILSKRRLEHVYVDAFAGGGVFKKRGGRQLEGRTWDQMPVISSGAQKFGAKRMTD